MKSIKFLKISKLFLFVIFLSCSKENHSLKGVSYITNKKIILSATSAEMYNFADNSYALEKDIYFDKNGCIIKFGRSLGEGLLYFYKHPKESQLRLDNDKILFRIKIDRIRNIIIENKDTIKDFVIKENKIITPKDKNGRIFIYTFK